MALFDPRAPCPYCGKPLSAQDDHIGFAHVASRNPLLAGLDDCVVHRKCLSEHPQRDEIVAAWNEAAGL